MSVDPMPNGYSSHIQPPKIEDAGTLTWWEAQYTAILTKLKDLVDHGKAQEAYKEIPMAMDMAQNYTSNGQNVEVSDKSNFDSTIGKYINAIQEDFDQYSSGKIPTDPNTGKPIDYAGDAQFAKSKIEALMKQYPEFADALGDVSNQLDAMFTLPSGQTDLASYWASLWKLPDPTDTSQKDAYQGTSVVSNAINAARNDVESQNTILNSQMQTYSKDASKDLAFEQDCFRSEMDMIKAPVTAAQSASS
ncbi:MAG: hypothetical protein KFB93_02955 [Simkaniaceae bacterium]|jgi:hypothetical protein|nr:MAG: hypothetical protein KFB93_02955 [Simkaniaceae bacterium]